MKRKWVAEVMWCSVLLVLMLVINLRKVDVNANSNFKSTCHYKESSNIPNEIYSTLKVKFPFIQCPMDINTAYTHINPEGEGEIAVYSAVDHVNGFFALFSKSGSQYKEVYCFDEPVYNVQITTNPSIIIYECGLGGTGVQENSFHVLRYTPKGYCEVFQEIASQIEFAVAPYYRLDGSIKTISGGNDELIYLLEKRIYDERGQRLVLTAEERQVKFFKYNEKTLKYELQ